MNDSEESQKDQAQVVEQLRRMQDTNREIVLMMVQREQGDDPGHEGHNHPQIDTEFPLIGAPIYAVIFGFMSNDGTEIMAPWMLKVPPGNMNREVFQKLYNAMLGMQEGLVRMALQSMPMPEIWELASMPRMRIN